MQKTWFITGAGRGLGLEITRAALAAGDNVVAAARRPEQVAEAPGLLAVAVDVTDAASVEAAAEAATDRFGRIDVLVNNAGYGQLGAFEELTRDAVEQQFRTNVFGTFDVTRAVLPVMRAQRAGHVITVSSTTGVVGFAGSSVYCASKFAVAGWSESLSQELGRFGINATVVFPGQFRTDFLDASSVRHGDLHLDDYRESSAAQVAMLDGVNHRQPGDPVRFGRAIVALAGLAEPPTQWAAGSEAVGVLLGRAEFLRGHTERWRAMSASTDLGDRVR